MNTSHRLRYHYDNQIGAFQIGDFVRFNTKYGLRTGIIEVITDCNRMGHSWGEWRAIITVRNGTGKPKKYVRALHKLTPLMA